MEWFKHLTSSHEDPDISDAWDQFGDAGIVVFWTMLEIYGKEFRHIDKDGYLTLSTKFLLRKTRRKSKHFWFILSFYQERGRINFKQYEKVTSFKIQKFIELSSNWTKRVNKEPTEAPTKSLQRHLPQQEEEEEDINTKEQEKHFQVLKDLSLKICDKYPKFNPYQFIQWAIKSEDEHLGCFLADIIPAFKYLISHDGIVSPWAECRKIAENEKRKREIIEREQSWETKKIQSEDDIKKWLGTMKGVP